MLAGTLSRVQLRCCSSGRRKTRKCRWIVSCTLRQCGLRDTPAEEPTSLGSNTLSTESGKSWIPGWTPNEMRDLQQADPGLHTVVSWLEEGLVPEQCPTRGSRHLQTLWAQRQQLTIHNGLLHRRVNWEDVPMQWRHAYKAAAGASSITNPSSAHKSPQLPSWRAFGSKQNIGEGPEILLARSVERY